MRPKKTTKRVTSVHEVLQRSLLLIRQGWLQEEFKESRNKGQKSKHYAYCSIGAIAETCDSRSKREYFCEYHLQSLDTAQAQAVNILNFLLGDKNNIYVSDNYMPEDPQEDYDMVVGFNDTYKRSKAEIIQLFKAAINITKTLGI